MFYVDQFKEALNVTKSVLEILPLDETANNNKIMIEETIRTNELKHSVRTILQILDPTIF